MASSVGRFCEEHWERSRTDRDMRVSTYVAMYEEMPDSPGLSDSQRKKVQRYMQEFEEMRP